MPNADSWICPKCLNDNPADCKYCHVCKSSRPAPRPERCNRCQRPLVVCECLEPYERVTDRELDALE